MPEQYHTYALKTRRIRYSMLPIVCWLCISIEYAVNHIVIAVKTHHMAAVSTSKPVGVHSEAGKNEAVLFRRLQQLSPERVDSFHLVVNV